MKAPPARRPPPPALRSRTGAPPPLRSNLVEPAPRGTDCCLSKCWWPATVVITFKDTGGKHPYCDDHAWPHRPKKLIRT